MVDRTAVDFLLEFLVNCKETDIQFNELEKLQVESFHEDLISLRTFLMDSEMSWCEQHEKVKDVVSRITDLANEAQDITASFTFAVNIEKEDPLARYFDCDHLIGLFDEVRMELRNMKKEVSEIYEQKLYGFGDPPSVGIMNSGESPGSSSSSSSSSRAANLSMVKEEETFVGFDNDIGTIRKRLASLCNHPNSSSRAANLSIVEEEETFISFDPGVETIRERLAGLFNHPNSSSTAAIDFLLKYLKRLIDCKEIPNIFFKVEKLEIESLYEDLYSLRTFLVDSEMIWYKHEELRDLVIRITDMANEAQDIIDSSIVSYIVEAGYVYHEARTAVYTYRVAGNIIRDYQSEMLINVKNEINSLKKEVSEIDEKQLYGIGYPHVRMHFGEISNSSPSSRAVLPIVEEETVVGFDHDLDMIRERLAGGSKQLDVISIVGMAGLGKTTLTKKLYNDAFVAYHFYIRGWTYVSQVYAKRDLLLSILSSIVSHRDGLFYTMSDEKLGEELYKRLKGNIYLIVMDDMWDTKAWDGMKIYFPNDNNGSRIIITSRLTEVALHSKPDSPPHSLHFLTKDESWGLLKLKVFGKESCPPGLVEIGEQIARKCQGLPLAIVVVAGLLAKTDKKKEEWEKVAGNLSSHIASDPVQCMNTLELSYNHLPPHLRLCFLYFGAFPEDYEIRVRKLIWLWIAEGFIHQAGQKTLEDVAEEYLRDLIDRSLVLVAKRKFSGGVGACRVHDLLRDLCIRKGKERNFIQHIYWQERLSPNLSYPSSCLIPIEEKQRRLCIFSHALEYISLKPCVPHIRSLLCFAPTQSRSFLPKNMSRIYRAFKLLRVLDLSAIYLPCFPIQILRLVLLRYLELRGTDLTLPKSICCLFNLETLNVLSQSECVTVPVDIWRMVNLRHLHVNAEYYEFPPATSEVYPSVLHNLQTISQLRPSKSCQVILARTPNLRKLGFYSSFKSKEWNFWFLDLVLLNHLETLKLFSSSTTFWTRRYSESWSLRGLKFPPNLRRLTLSNTHLDWEDMSTLGMLLNLEVLKLEYLAFVGPRWETIGGGFLRLKFLRLRHIDFVQWEASKTDFPSLQKLVLQGCGLLQGIPFDLGNIHTLQRIEVTSCSRSTNNSARRIKEEQQNMGNDWLNVIIESKSMSW